MDLGKRAHYNALRLDWLKNPSLPVEDWQVEEYREMPYSILFERLRQRIGDIDRVSFNSYAEEFDSPEELVEALTKELPLTIKDKDRVYLLIFELWRRLIVERPSLSIFCDELDHKIALYQQGRLKNLEVLEDLLDQLQLILDGNIDNGGSAEAIFSYISSGCAHDLEAFLIDYIFDQIDEDNHSYVKELIEDFDLYLHNNKRFQLAQIKLHAACEGPDAILELEELAEELLNQKEQSLDFNLELLHLLAEEAETGLFYKVARLTLPLITNEDELEEFIDICILLYEELEEDLPLQTLEALQQRAREGQPLKTNIELLTEILQNSL